MSKTSKINRGQPRLCLLTTLLFLLCIYIKRVNSTTTTTTTTCQQHLPYDHNNTIFLSSKWVFSREMLYELRCPVEEAIDIREEYKHSKKVSALREQLKQTAQVCGWTKNKSLVHRSNGNPIVNFNETDPKSLLFAIVGKSDEGTYECRVQFNVSRSHSRYFNLFEFISFELEVAESVLPDILPAISHPPADQYVNLGDDVSFTCKKVVTLLSPVTRWFKSTCNADELCTLKFLQAFNKTIDTQNWFDMKNYIIEGENTDEFNLQNVTAADVGYYGCLAHNTKGLDIRLGSLRLFKSKADDFTTISYNDENHIGNAINTTTTTDYLIRSNGAAEPGFGRRVGTAIGATLANQLFTTETASSTQAPKGTNQYLMYVILLLILVSLLYLIYESNKNSSKSKKNQALLYAPTVGQICAGENIKQHLPKADCPDIFCVGKTSDGFITGHLSQKSGHTMTQSICSGILDKEKNPSISSNNSNNSDEASSWGKSTKSDLSRNLYRHTSNDTTTTVPMYDHPPATNNAALCGIIVHDDCVSNPTYGLLRHEDDATDWIFPRRNLERLNKIGEGQFGEVWRYIARQKDGNENYVAVKQLKNRVGLGDRERLELVAEIEIMKSVNKHPNVIKLLNYCVDDQEPLLLIMEYAENGKLQTYLRNCRTTSFRNPYGSTEETCNYIPIPVTSKELIKFSYHIAKGMEYVASKGIIHRDLASRNILLSKEKVCKVADFGFARRITDECAYERTTASPVPVKWMAPEALVENKFTSKSDVFSLGILMWEIVTLGATPYENLNSQDVYRKVTAGGRLERPLHCKDAFYKIMCSCWLQNPADRPTFKEIANQLEKLLLSDNDYIQLDEYPEHAYYNISYK